MEKEHAMPSCTRNVFSVFVLLGLFLAGGWGTPGPLAMHHDHKHDHGDMHQVHDELDFLAEMIPHHQEAVDSSQKIMAITERPELEAFAEEIIEVQKREIEQLEEWIRLWYGEPPAQVRYQPMMRSFENLSPEQAEKAFLEDMIVHHEMAVKMSQQLLEKDLAQHPEVEAMARSIVETQQEEIGLMEKWLQEWFEADPAPHDGHGHH